MYEVINNIDIPQHAQKRTRKKGALTLQLENLEVGQGFYFDSPAPLKSQYPKVAPRKFPGKRFRIWEAQDDEGNTIKGKYGVARIQ